MIEFVRKPPEWAKLSEHLKDKAEGYIVFLLSGRRYCVPLSPEMKKVCGISRVGSRLVLKYSEHTFNKMLMQIADAMYLQVRDTVGAEVAEDLSGQLADFLEEKFDGPIRGLVDKRLEQGLLPEKTEVSPECKKET